MENKTEQPSNNTPYYGNDRQNMIEFIPENALKILEVGCAEGKFSSLLIRNDRELWGVEIDEKSAKVAQEKLHKVFVSDFDSIYSQLPKNYFDCVIFNDVLEHIYAPWETVEKVKSLLSENGVLVTSIPNIRYITVLLLEIIGKKDFIYRPEGGILDITHVRFFTSKSILRMFQECGYNIITHKGINACKSWKERLFIFLSFGFFSDSRYKQFATVSKPVK